MAWELVQYADGKVEEVWREMPMPDTKELEKEYYAALAEESGPIASRIADSYAALIERAEKAEAEVERLKEEINVMREGATGLLKEHVSLDIAAKQAHRLYAENQQMRAVMNAACELHKFFRSTIGGDGAPLELTSTHPDGDVYMAGAADRLTALYDALKAHPLVGPEMYLESNHPEVLEELEAQE